MYVTYQNQKIAFEDLPLECGYATQSVTLEALDGSPHACGGQTGHTSLIVTLPFVNEAVRTEMAALFDACAQSGLPDVTYRVITASPQTLENATLLVDREGEFQTFYGLGLEQNPWKFSLAKALLIITKDGALFYDEIVPNLEQRFDIEKALNKLYAATRCYTGQGCHA